MSEHKYNEAYSKGYKNGQKDQCLADTVDDAMYMLSKLGNVTNGDMIKAMFPNCKIILDNDGYIGLRPTGENWIVWVTQSWWNALYKKEVEE